MIENHVFRSLLGIFEKAVNAYRTFGYALSLSFNDIFGTSGVAPEGMPSWLWNFLIGEFNPLWLPIKWITGADSIYAVSLIDFVFGNLIIISILRVIVRVSGWVTVNLVGGE